MKNWGDYKIDKSWSLFLDRDGVINEKLDNDYVKKVEEFRFIEGSKEAILDFNNLFKRTVVVTNQQGIAKGLMTEKDLNIVHNYMLDELKEIGAKLDKVYFCPDLAAANAPCRKPNTGMALEAKKDFPEIDFEKSIMVGDSLSDIQMGKKMGMLTVYIKHSQSSIDLADYNYPTLFDFAKDLLSRD